MKRNLVIVTIVILLFSCQESNLEFSCDAGINEFVIKNLGELSSINIYELVSYDIQLQRAIFNTWDYQKKRNACIEKLDYVLLHVPFTESEKAHIQTLIGHINEDYFLKENIEKNPEIRSGFAVKWINYSINYLGWSNQFIAFMVYRLYTDQAQLNSELSMLRVTGAKINTNSEPGDCDCNVSVDFCGNVDCISTGCTTVSTGCGWLWSMTCDGNCY